LKAELEMSEKLADRVKAYESHLLRMKELEGLYKDKIKGGLAADVATAEFYRLDAEVMLERAKASEER
jgi:hypothetical protein